MKTFYKSNCRFIKQLPCWLVFVLLVSCQPLFAQPAIVSNPLAIGQNCGGGSNNFKSFAYDSVLKKLTQIGANCNPSLAAPGFNPGGGSIAFSPKDQKVYYIETTTGNNSIVWSWTPGVCPTSSQAPVYTYPSTFIVGLEFNAITGDGYQLEFSTGSSPYSIYLRKVTSFSPLVTGATQQIFLPVGKNIYQQNGDIVITPTGDMYFVLDNKMFNLDYTPYGIGTLNAKFIDTIKNGVGNNVIGLAYAGGKFVASVLGSTCTYKQLDIASGLVVAQPVTLSSGTFTSYDMASMVTGIGAAKRLNSLSKTGSLTYKVTYDIKVKNYGNVNLNNVQVTDAVQTAFGATFVSASVAAVGVMPSGLTLNPSFNGINVLTGINIFASGSTMKASPADSATIRVTVNLNNPNVAATYYNSAIATATGAIFANNVRDSSDNQASLNPDMSGTDVPDLKGQGVPTPITPVLWLLLGNDIVNFNANRSGTAVNLYWTLDNQVPGTTTALQRSANGASYETLAIVGSKDVSFQYYNWQDAHPLSPDNYYRLEIRDPGGKINYSNLIIIRNTLSSVALSVSPNPFMQSLKFSIDLEKAGKIKYRILDFVSVVMQSAEYSGHQGHNEVDIPDISRMPAGSYTLDVFVEDKHYLKKVIKY